jgi:hypothetical protein
MSVRAQFLSGIVCTAIVGLDRPGAADTPTLDGNAMLARVAAGRELQSYAVPASFQVRMRRPIGAGGIVGGMIYYRSPADAALVITKAPPLIGAFFKGTYILDLVPQVWSSKYHVASISRSRAGNVDTYLLHALPTPAGDVDRVTFTVAQETLAPLGATWVYRDGSSIALSIPNTAPPYLPQTESIVVTMPKYALDATCTVGSYALNAPVPDGTFKQTER